MNTQPVCGRALLNLISISMLAIPAVGFAVAAHADTESASFGVSATVLPSCSISGATLDFGSLDVLSEANVDAGSTLTASCTAGSSFSIALRSGIGAGAAATSRKVTETTDGTGNGIPQAIPVYGRITAGPSAAAMGLYNDTLIATIDF